MPPEVCSAEKVPGTGSKNNAESKSTSEHQTSPLHGKVNNVG